MSTSPAAQPAERAAFDVTTPNIARVYDYWLGGKDHFAADRAEAERLLAIYPDLPRLARENRQFQVRAISWLAAQGIRQFLDIGSGLPTARNTHQVAQEASLACHVVYVDNDPVVMSHARALLTGSGVGAVQGDLADPAAILADPDVLKLIDPGEPAAVILGMVLHFFDADTARKITAAFMSWLAPGSCVVISVGSGDDQTGGRLAREYAAGTLYNHAPDLIAEFFAGLELVSPGLVEARHWDPTLSVAPAGRRPGRILAGVGRKPQEPLPP
jgi:hypothetical protein